MSCALCDGDGGLVLWRERHWRLVRVLDAPSFPAFYRLIWNDHVAEFSDLSREQRQACMEAVCGIEQALREQLRPTKINIASLGNVVPHLHWHVIARFADDSHFPNPIWGETVHEGAPRELDLAALDAAVLQSVKIATV